MAMLREYNNNMQKEDLIKLCPMNLESPGWMKLR